MPSICISRDLLGEALDIKFDTCKRTYTLIDAAALTRDDVWTLGMQGRGMRLEDLAALSNLKIRTAPDDRFRNSFTSLSYGGIIKWRHAVPKKVFDVFLNDVINDAENVLAKGCIEYYTNTFKNTEKLLASLRRASIDEDRLNTYINAELNPSNVSTLTSFRCNDEGLADAIVYNRFGTTTGRLTVSSGPNVLILKKLYKNIIRSRHTGGKIISIDYSSLEPRVIMASMGRNAPDDIYTHVINDVTHSSLTKKQAKIVTISLLYGASKSTIGKLSGLNDKELTHAIKSIRAYFEIDKLHDRLLDEIKSSTTNSILNHYGRPIIVDDRKNISNAFAQSSAVDAALLGFYEGVKWIETNDLDIKPLYIIHDACIFDVAPSGIGRIDDVARACEKIPGLSARFPVKVEVIQ